jgi:hypothetical protein
VLSLSGVAPAGRGEPVGLPAVPAAGCRAFGAWQRSPGHTGPVADACQECKALLEKEVQGCEATSRADGVRRTSRLPVVRPFSKSSANGSRRGPWAGCAPVRKGR